MNNIKTLVATALIGLCSMNFTASAQCSENNCSQEAHELGYKPYPYGFVQLQGGVSTTFTDVNAFKLLTPTYSVAGGYMFGRAIGARLHVNGYESTGGFKTAGDPLKYKFKYINTNADLMINMTNLVSSKQYHLFNLYFIGFIRIFGFFNFLISFLKFTHINTYSHSSKSGSSSSSSPGVTERPSALPLSSYQYVYPSSSSYP